MFYPYLDWTLIILLPGIILAGWAQASVSGNFNKYSKEQTASGKTGADIAREILKSNDLGHVQVGHINGELSDHYDPTQKIVRLSDSVYNSTSIAAQAVAAHECGHAIQDQVGYKPMQIRSALVPVANFSTQASWFIVIMGIILGSVQFSLFGALLFCVAVLFQLATLPVEFDASSRALTILTNEGLMESDELDGAKKMLRAAAMTYVAALITSILTLVRLVVMSLMYRRNRW